MRSEKRKIIYKKNIVRHALESEGISLVYEIEN